ncbi:hypothetical protein EVA_17931 [gut metagenome]|uniref:Uncharacterized protein n=1 Tax=gut metagenome TaxID=749906 RepID=J9FHQ4_9ZZZZ
MFPIGKCGNQSWIDRLRTGLKQGIKKRVWKSHSTSRHA